MDFREIGGGGMVWIDLAQDRDQWRTLVKSVMNLRGKIERCEILEQFAQLAASQEGLTSMKLVKL
jgi:hypothetical protein